MSTEIGEVQIAKIYKSVDTSNHSQQIIDDLNILLSNKQSTQR
jgi:hypothetical protein